jgi:hypothetical protein
MKTIHYKWTFTNSKLPSPLSSTIDYSSANLNRLFTCMFPVREVFNLVALNTKTTLKPLDSLDW